MSESENELIVYPDGTQRCYQDNRLHREDGPAYIKPDGTQRWYRFGQIHREDGPAILYPDGTQCWCQFGRMHREDGPAEVYPNDLIVWWINDRQISVGISSYLDDILSEKRKLRVELEQKE